MTQTDFWPDGVYDNQATGRREVWKDGRLCRYAMRNCCGDTETSWSVLRRKWGAPHDATGCEHCRDDCDGIAMPPNTRNQPAEPR